MDLKDAYFTIPICSVDQKYLKISLGKEILLVPVSPIWGNNCTVGIHQVNESSCKLPSTHGNEVSDIPRRYSCHEPDKTGSFRRWQESEKCFRKFRIHDKSQEIHSIPCARDRISGIHNRFQFDDPVITHRKSKKKDKENMPKALRSDTTSVRKP